MEPTAQSTDAMRTASAPRKCSELALSAAQPRSNRAPQNPIRIPAIARSGGCSPRGLSESIEIIQSGQHVVDAQPGATLAAYPEVDVFVRYEAEALLPALLRERIAE